MLKQVEGFDQTEFIWKELNHVKWTCIVFLHDVQNASFPIIRSKFCATLFVMSVFEVLLVRYLPFQNSLKEVRSIIDLHNAAW